MGYIRHHGILVTGTYGEWAEKAHKEAVRIRDEIGTGIFGPCVAISELAGPMVNDTWSFAVFPDGSKEGWGESDAGDSFRERFMAWLRGQMYEDGSSPLGWVVVQYGDNECETKVIADSDEARRDPTRPR